MGCEQSVPVTGHSERFLLQTDALKSSQKQAKEDDNKILSPPMLDSDGNPTLEEIAARTSHSRFNIKIVLGTPETPIHVEVRSKLLTERQYETLRCWTATTTNNLAKSRLSSFSSTPILSLYFLLAFMGPVCLLDPTWILSRNSAQGKSGSLE